MKRLLTLCMMLLCSWQLWAQDCYNSTRDQGITLYNQGKFTKAKSFFTEAKNCPDAPVGNDLDTWIGKCNTAIDSANAQAAANQMASKGYMQITTIRFCNEDADNNMIDTWGSTLYAGSVCYLKPAVVYRGLDTREHTVKVQVKIFEDNLLSQSSNSPEGYTYEKEITVKPGENTFTLPGWGNANPGSYGQTSVVRVEIYYNGRKLKSQEITLQPGIKPQGGGNSGGGNSGVVDRGNDQGTGASYLRVDNKTTVNSSWSGSAGTETYYVSTDGNNYKVWLLPSWCRLTARTATSFTIAWENNPGGERTDWFEVVSNGHEVRVNVTQAAGSGGSSGSGGYSSVDGGNDENTGATYLRVDNKTDVNSSWSAAAGSETYYVSTDGSDYLVKWLPSWATLTARSRNSFTISWEANTSITRKDWFRVTTNGVNVDVHVVQAKAAGARDASYLKVDNKTEVNSSWSGSAGSETYYVSTDASDYHVTLLPSWCEVTNKTSTSFTISWEANTTGSSRSDWFRVESGDCRVKVNVTQSNGGSSSGASSSYSQTPNALSRKEWATLMRKAVDYVTFNYSNGAYKGQTRNGVRHGIGVYWWSEDGDYYWGDWENGNEDGLGIYMMGDDSYNVSNCPNCRYFVGKFASDKKSGKGTCYDSWGNLIYYGEFSNDSPTESYPNGDGYTSYKFEAIEYSGGDMYVGETKNGQRHGMGIYLWASGGSWVGNWSDGERDGYGAYLSYEGAVTTGTWRGDTKVD